MRYLLIVLLGTVVLSGCKSKPEDEIPPSNVLNKDEMIAVMADIHLAESFGYMLRVESIDKELTARQEYAKVMKTHNLDWETFIDSYNWYMDHPAVFDPMYEKVLDVIKESEQFAIEHSPGTDSTEADPLKTVGDPDFDGKLKKLLPEKGSNDKNDNSNQK